MIEKHPKLELVEVFMIDEDSYGGSPKYKGNIYQIEKFKAEDFEKNGTGIIIDVPEINVFQKRIDSLAQKLQDEVDKVNHNARLSPQGKREDVTELLNKYQVEADEIQEAYKQKLAFLKRYELENLQKAPTGAKLSLDEARTQAGIFRSELSMIDDYDESVGFINTRIGALDVNVNRELLAQFSEIKKELEEKGESRETYSSTANAYAQIVRKQQIQELYGKLKEATYGPGQAKSANKYDMLSAIEKQRGDIRFDYGTKVTAIKSAHGIQ